MEKTKSNKKLIIIVAVMVLTVVALAGVLVGVFAATAQTVGTGFSISYDVGTNIAAKVKTQYQIGDGELVTVQGYNPNTNKLYTVDSQGYTTFNADASDGSGESKDATAPTIDISLSPSTPTITFYFEVRGLGQSMYELVGALNGTIDSKFSYKLFKMTGESIYSTGYMDSTEYGWSDMRAATGQNGSGEEWDDIYFKVELTVKDLNTAFTASGTNASFNLSLTHA